jgi:arginine N-succinyltransferase
MIRYEIRAALPDDHEQIVNLARHLDSVNLPHDAEHIAELLAQSERSFQGQETRERARYLFLLWDNSQNQAVGTSSIVAQLGTNTEPYIYLDVIDEEKYSRALDKHFFHTVLRLGTSYNGPTEIAGLVVGPSYRAAPERLGQMISAVRFLFIAQNRALFRDELLAELLPPLEPDGTSHLWEAFGRRFTKMSYQEADFLSSQNKDFIRELFPSGPVHTSLMSEEARNVIGEVGEQTKGVERMLTRIGFRYCQRVDPFDGGPHFTARTRDISWIEQSRTLRVGNVASAVGSDCQQGLIAVQRREAPYFRAVWGRWVESEPGQIKLEPLVTQHLELRAAQELSVLPLGSSERG